VGSLFRARALATLVAINLIVGDQYSRSYWFVLAVLTVIATTLRSWYGIDLTPTEAVVNSVRGRRKIPCG
jgi:hypothetical protein